MRNEINAAKKSKKLLSAGLLGGLTLAAGVAGIFAGMSSSYASDNKRGYSNSSIMIIADTNKDGTISKEERTAFIQRLFAVADIDKSGDLSAEEIQNGMHNLVFDEMDQNKDGTISKDEFNQMHNNQRMSKNDRSQRGLERMLKKIDDNNDGKISMMEMEAFGDKMGDRSYKSDRGYMNNHHGFWKCDDSSEDGDDNNDKKS